MKKKLLVLLLTLFILSAATGCNSRNSLSQAETTNSSSVIQGASDSSQGQTTDSDGTETSESSSESQSGLSFDFDETIKNIELFGETISLPCKIEDISDDFSLDYGVKAEGEEKQTLYLLYHLGEKIGSVVIEELKNGDNMLIGLTIDSNNAKNEFHVAGIGFESSKSKIISALGEPFETRTNSLLFGVSRNRCISIHCTSNSSDLPSSIEIIARSG